MVNVLWLTVLLLVGCVHRVEERCPSCTIVDARHDRLPKLKAGTKQLFVLVPGGLGWGWEWDAVIPKLRATPGVDFVVFWWEPWANARRSAIQLRDRIHSSFRQLPADIELVVVAHSAAGLIAAYALEGLRVPEGRKLEMVLIGAPLAGMQTVPISLDDPIDSPLFMGVAGSFRRYPDPPRGVHLVEYVTSAKTDPVMKTRFGHLAAPKEIGPRGAERRVMDPKMDHNFAVELVMDDLLRRAR